MLDGTEYLHHDNSIDMILVLGSQESPMSSRCDILKTYNKDKLYIFWYLRMTCLSFSGNN